MLFFFIVSISQSIKALEGSIPDTVPISVSIDQMDASFIEGSCSTDYECTAREDTRPDCGKMCLGNNNNYFQYEFRGVQFQIYGSTDPNYGDITIHVDDTEAYTITTSGNSNKRTLLYTSKVYSYNNHKIRVENGNNGKEFGIYKFTYWPSLQAKRINFTDDSLGGGGNWQKRSDGIGGIVGYTNNPDSSAQAILSCSKIWIYGPKSPNNGNIRIKINDDRIDSPIDDDTININNEKIIEGCLFYESTFDRFGTYNLEVLNPNKLDQDNNMFISLSYIFYEYDPPTQTQAPNPTHTLAPLEPDSFINKEFHDYIPSGFPSFEAGQELVVKEITNCKFYNIVVEGNFIGGPFNQEFPFYNNTFEYTDGVVNPTIAYSNLETKFKIDHCTFTNFKYVKQTGEGLIFSFNHRIDLTFESCTFNNIGQSDAHIFFKLNGENSSLIMRDCTFYNSGSKISNFINSNIVFERCTFTKPARDMIRINQDWLAHGTFVFTDNIVQKNKRQFIMATQIKSPPIIKNNIFQNIDMIGGYLITFTMYRTAANIELLNNTFSQITTKTDYSYGGGIGNWYQNIHLQQTNLKYTNCKFYDITNDNVLDPFNQGGAMQYGRSTSISNVAITFTGCEFKRNKCTNGYGGALAFSIDHNLEISNCIFEDNYAFYQGGAIYFSSKIEKPTDNPDAPSFSGNMQIESILINNCQFKGNKCGDGHAIYINEYYDLSNAKLHIIDCDFNDNGAIDSYLIVANIGRFIFESSHVTNTNSEESVFYMNYEKVKQIEITDSDFSNIQTSQNYCFDIQATNSESIIFENCNFRNCKAALFIIRNTIDTITIDSCNITFDSSDLACGAVECGKNGFIARNSCFIRTNAAGALKMAQTDEVGQVVLENLLFEECVGSNHRCLDFSLYTKDFVFRNNVFQYMQASGNSGYFLSISLNFNTEEILFDNITFQYNTCNSDYGGGSGIWITDVDRIKFLNCHFKGNVAAKSPNGRDKYPTEPIERIYHSGDGGAVQYGFSNTIYNVDMIFDGCEFVDNGAVRHGGALALQTIKEVIITNCIFRNNKANHVFAVPHSAELLNYKNYFSLKTNGRGGAIYINPAFNHEGQPDADKGVVHMKSVLVEKCTFEENGAFDGHSIYIQGDDPEIPITIRENSFIHHYSTDDEIENLKDKSIILSEIKRIDDVTSDNNFKLYFNNDENSQELPTKLNYIEPEDTEEDGPDSFEIENVTTHGRHEYKIQDNSKLIVSIQISIFCHIKTGSSDGGALYIANAGLACQDITFLNCSSDARGGAIFYHNTYDTTNYVNIIRNNITDCSANLGGGLFIYSTNKRNRVTVRYCHFERNNGKAKKETDEIYGGSGIFAACKNGRIKQNVFIDNVGDGSTLKFYNNYQNEIAKRLSDDNAISEPKEKFVIEENKFVVLGSDSAISYTRGNGHTLVELSGCTFEGDINKDTHFIEGETRSNDSPKLIIKDCDFTGSLSDAFASDSDFLSFNLKDKTLKTDIIMKVDEKKSRRSSSKSALIVVVTATIAVIAIVGFFIFKVKKSSTSDFDDDDDTTLSNAKDI